MLALNLVLCFSLPGLNKCVQDVRWYFRIHFHLSYQSWFKANCSSGLTVVNGLSNMLFYIGKMVRCPFRIALNIVFSVAHQSGTGKIIILHIYETCNLEHSVTTFEFSDLEENGCHVNMVCGVVFSWFWWFLFEVENSSLAVALRGSVGTENHEWQWTFRGNLANRWPKTMFVCCGKNNQNKFGPKTLSLVLRHIRAHFFVF